MTDDFLHPTPDYDATDWEQRQYVDGDGQPLEVTLERFYWLHLDWYDEKGFLFSEGGLGKMVARLERDRGPESLNDALRVFVDHWMIPTAVRSGFPPFDQLDEETRIAMTRDAEVFSG